MWYGRKNNSNLVGYGISTYQSLECSEVVLGDSMVTLTKQEKLTIAYADLAKVNAAIDQMLQGKMIQRVEIGSHEFRRVYDYQKLSLNDLREIRRELLEYIDTFEGETSVSYRQGASVPLVVNRRF